MGDPSIRPYRRVDFESCARVLASAFEEDAGFTYVARDRKQRAQVVGWSQKISLYCAAKRGKVFILGEPTQAVAAWLPPGAYPLRYLDLLRGGAWSGPLRFRPHTLKRLIDLAMLPDRIHARTLPGPHWYLLALAVRPDAQGRGLGSQLLREGLQLVDASGLPCGLDTANPRALALYQRFGFEVAFESQLPKNGPPVWLLTRQAASHSSR